ncbi:MAG: HupE/UreJ family protein [Opitutaceae bacterium]|nr:HupE/UreJ family protein [Opitutaceae bacterium]
MNWNRLLAGLGLCGLLASAHGHEVRSGYLRIAEDAQHRYTVRWKQPDVGGYAARLVPHLSNGWLEKEPSSREATADLAITSWNQIAGAAQSLEGQELSIEGIENTITDVFVDVALADGSRLHGLINFRHPTLVFHFGRTSAVPMPAYVNLGIGHILMGIDHLLFVLGLVLLVGGRWKLVQTISAFTAGHSLSLAAATLGYASVRPALVNVLIALSILFLGPEIMRVRKGGISLTTRYPWMAACAFGLLHGLGFASGLTAVGLPKVEIPLALLFFNIGVEIGQLAFIGLILALRRAFRILEVRWPQPVALMPAYAIGVLGAFWTIQRLAVIWKGVA